MTIISSGETLRAQYGASDTSLDLQSDRPSTKKQWLDDGKTFEKALLRELKQTGSLSFASLSIGPSVQHAHVVLDADDHQASKDEVKEPVDQKPAHHDQARGRGRGRSDKRYFFAEFKPSTPYHPQDNFGLPTGQVFFNGEGRPIPLPASMTRQSVSLSGEGNQIILPDGAVFDYDPWMATIDDRDAPGSVETMPPRTFNDGQVIEGEWAYTNRTRF